MSRHKLVAQEATGTTWVFGWDNMLQSFYLQKYVPNVPEDSNPVVWLGADAETRMYDVEDLVKAAQKQGLHLGSDAISTLYNDRDEGL